MLALIEQQSARWPSRCLAGMSKSSAGQPPMHNL